MTKDRQILKYGIGISWLTSWFLIIPISLISLIVTIYKLAIRKSKLTKYAILLSPFVVLPILNIGMGIIDYAQGDARLQLIGFPAPEFANIHPEYRIGQESLGCTITGTEYLTSFRYNQTVKFLIKNFGYQKGSYIGTMPNKVAAKELLKEGTYEFGKIELENADQFRITHPSISLQINLTEQDPFFKRTIQQSEIRTNPKLKILDRCLISQINEDWIYLIDLDKKRIIAQYSTK